MIKRPNHGLFPGLHVFPGGHLDEQDMIMTRGSEIDALKICAIRETVEETGILPIPQSILSGKTSITTAEDFPDLLKKLKISDVLKLIPVHPWIMWRTPDCPSVYPQQWDMLISITFLAENEEEFKVKELHQSNEATAIEWLEVGEILSKNYQKIIDLAPPQWFVMKKLQKILDMKEFQSELKSLPSKYPKFIHPKLVSDESGTKWHSILPEDKYYHRPEINVNNVLRDKNGPFHRIEMKRFDGKFHDFNLME